MHRLARARDELKRNGLKGLLEKIFSMYIWRTEWMMEFLLRAGDLRHPETKPLPYTIEILDRTRYAEALGTSPHLNPNDLEEFARWEAYCVVARHEGDIISSIWLVRGNPYLRELRSRIRTGSSQYHICRAHMDPQHRGKRITGHLLHFFAKNHALPNETLRSLIYDWNVASIRASEFLGFEYRRDIGFAVLLGIRWCRFRERRFLDRGG